MMTINITAEAYKKMYHYILATDLEISGLGTIVQTPEGLLIDDVFIFQQEVTNGSTDIDMEAVAKVLLEMDAAGKDTNTIKIWWHSHNTMQAFFSGIDTKTIAQLGKTFPYLISIVGNHRMQFRVRLDVFKPLRITQEAQLNIVYDDVAMAETIKGEVDTKVTGEVWGYNRYDGNYGNNYKKKKTKADYMPAPVANFYYETDKKLSPSYDNCYGQHVSDDDTPTDKWCWEILRNEPVPPNLNKMYGKSLFKV